MSGILCVGSAAMAGAMMGAAILHLSDGWCIGYLSLAGANLAMALLRVIDYTKEKSR